LNMATSN